MCNLQLRRARILVVEDDPAITATVVELLTEWGYDVIGTADTQVDAVHLAECRQPCCILMDVQLAEQRDAGVQAARQIRSRSPVPILFLSGQSGDELAQVARTLGAAGVLSKPYRPSSLRSAVAAALDWSLENRAAVS